MSAGIKNQPGEGIVSFQHISATENNIRMGLTDEEWCNIPQDICGVVAVQTVNPATGWLRHQTIVASQGKVGTVDVQSWLEEHGVTGLQVRRTRPKPNKTVESCQRH